LATSFFLAKDHRGGKVRSDSRRRHEGKCLSFRKECSSEVPPSRVATLQLLSLRAALKSLSGYECEIAVGDAQNFVKGSKTNPEVLFSNMI
jgi:hypothetical protein